MNIAIVGFDTEGRATLEYLRAQGHTVSVRDQNKSTAIPEGIESALGEAYLDGLDTFDRIVRTAGMHPHVILDKNPDVADKITSHTNLFFENSPTKNIVGVTGTKGKGTTSTLIAKMLEEAGKDVRLGGNIGVPPLTFINELSEDSWVVLELSSFQLIDLRHSPPIATCLMVVPEHLNWHEDMEEYIAAKQQLFIHQDENDTAIYFPQNENSVSIADASLGIQIPYYEEPGAFVRDDAIIIDGQEICKTSEVKLLGQHNWQNACAAATTVWQVTRDIEAIRAVLTSFSGLEHRLEFVRELDGVRYYDDSFGTTPETAIVALEAFEAPKVVILGGSDKGASYDELAKAVTRTNVRTALLIGDQAPRIQDALDAAGFTEYQQGGDTMTDIVQKARSIASPGDIVLLSTGCASFGMFKDYKDRGSQFKTAVRALA